MTPARKPPRQLTPLELQIMHVLWDIGPAPVQAVQERLSGEKLAYTTVQTMLNVLHRKGRVKRTLRGSGRPPVRRIRRRPAHEPGEDPPARRSQDSAIERTARRASGRATGE
jgi:Penicillinase repressor